MASASTWERSETSHCTPITSAPLARKVSAAFSKASLSISARTIFIPSSTNFEAKPIPMPLAPPVITATRPSKSFIMSLSVFRQANP